MSDDPTRMCELLLGLPEVTLLEVTDCHEMVRVTVRPTRHDRCVLAVAARSW